MSESELVAAVERVRRSVVQRTGNIEENEDLVQDAILRAWRKPGMFETDDDLREFLEGEVVLLGRRNRARRNERQQKLKQAVEVTSQQERGTCEAEDRIALEQAIAEEAPELQESLWNVIVKGVTYRETGVPLGTLADAVERVRGRLR